MRTSAPALSSPFASGTATITVEEVEAAQIAWGEALVSISKAFDDNGLSAAMIAAQHAIDTLYGYDIGPVLFKPTLSVAPRTFRTTREGALAYFVGHSSAFPDDTGFGLRGWRSFEIFNAGISIHGETATSMGRASLTDKDGKVTSVDKTWTYRRATLGRLKIIVHHSSLPFEL